MENPLQKENQYTTRPHQASMRHESSPSLILVMIITFIACGGKIQAIIVED
jgi:hypothetical protein